MKIRSKLLTIYAGILLTIVLIVPAACTFGQVDSSLLEFQAPYEYKDWIPYTNMVKVQTFDNTVIPVTSSSEVKIGIVSISANYQDLRDLLSEYVAAEGGDPALIEFHRWNLDDYLPPSKFAHYYKIYFPVMIEIESLVAALRNKPYIRRASRPYIIHLDGVPNNDIGITSNTYHNWHIYKIQAPEAWVFMQAGSGNPEVVAIVDVGQVFDIHQELTGKVTNSPYTYCPEYGEHATEVASCIVANVNNTGPVGVGHNYIRVGSYSMNCGIEQALNELINDTIQSRIINCSWHFTGPTTSHPPFPPLSPVSSFSKYEDDEDWPEIGILQNLIENGMLIIASSCNRMSGVAQLGVNPLNCLLSGTDEWCLHQRGIPYPCGLPDVIGAGATSPNYSFDFSYEYGTGTGYEFGMGSGNDVLTYELGNTSGGNFNYNCHREDLDETDYMDIMFQNEGYLDIVAPGVDIDMAWYDEDNPSATNLLITGSGTSMSSPIISGVAASMWYVNPILTRNAIIRILFETADKVGYNPNGLILSELNNTTFTKGYRYYNYGPDLGGFNDQNLDYIMGHGRVNMLSAVMNAAGLIQPNGFTIDNSTPFIYDDIIIYDANEQSYLTGNYNRQYEYDAILNQDGAQIILNGAGVSLTLEPNSTFRISNNATLIFENDAELFLLPGTNEQVTKIVVEKEDPYLPNGGILSLGYKTNIEENTMLIVDANASL
ncbi:MAG: S8/S53 family peptidase, partial [Bacteroidia bacterium]|nr:S8/S53 family peptidase [Bacteroidia bacterium]